MSIERCLRSEEAQLAFGAELAPRLRGLGGLVALRGELGTGKTTLVRGLLRALGHQGPVRSPTFTLIEPYETDAGQVFHLDLYRLADPEELEWLGIRDLLDGTALVLVEWPEQGAGVLPPAQLDISITHAPPGRRVRLTPSAPWQDRFADLADQC